MERARPKVGLMLTGGGARAAYQVVVLKAIRGLLPDQAKNPFPILCGTPAGAGNAAVLAIHADDFRSGAGLASYMLFEDAYCSAIIDLGHRGTYAQRDAVVAFLGGAAQ